GDDGDALQGAVARIRLGRWYTGYVDPRPRLSVPAQEERLFAAGVVFGWLEIPGGPNVVGGDRGYRRKLIYVLCRVGAGHLLPTAAIPVQNKRISWLAYRVANRAD